MAALLKTALAVLGPARGGVSAEMEMVERALREAESELLSA